MNVSVAAGNLAISSCGLIETKQYDTIAFVKNAKLDNIRNQWDNGEWPSDCKHCKQAELSGLISRRQGSNQWYKDNNLYNTETELVRLDYWTGNYCNLRCAICGPIDSSAWMQELGHKFDIKPEINYFWKTIDVSKLQHVHFNGGEPLLSKDHILFLESLPNKSKVSINYNTNATIRPSKKLLDLWSEFRLVSLDFSIDDIGARFEYQRYPAKWQDVVGNLHWYRDNSPVNTMFGINTTVSILNKSNIHNLEKWVLENFSNNRLGDTVSIKKQAATGKLSLDNTNTAAKYLDSLDARRGTSWQDTFPELVNVI